MRIMVISDTHGDLSWMEKAQNDIESADRIIHLGDNVADAKKMAQRLKRNID